MTHSQKLRDSLKILLASELGGYTLVATDGTEKDGGPSIRIVPPQVPDNIKMKVIGDRGIECLIYQDPRVEPSSQVDFEYYEVVLRQHNLNQPTSNARKLITDLFSGVKPMRQQQAQIKGETRLEQVFLEIPRFKNFDSEYILKKIEKLTT